MVVPIFLEKTAARAKKRRSSNSGIAQSPRKGVFVLLLLAGAFVAFEFTLSYQKQVGNAVGGRASRPIDLENLSILFLLGSSTESPPANQKEARDDDIPRMAASDPPQTADNAKTIASSVAKRPKSTPKATKVKKTVATKNPESVEKKKSPQAVPKSTKAVSSLDKSGVTAPNAASNQPSTAKEKEPQSTTTYRTRLLQEWKEFETHWTNGTGMSDYLESNRAQEELPYKRLPDFILPAPHNTTRDIVLAAHMSIGGDKLSRLDLLQRSWQGPMSLAIRIRSQEEAESFLNFYDSHPAMASNWTVHFLLEYKPPSIQSAHFAAQYCHNRLRNLALHSPSISDFVLAVDLDFVPTQGGYPKLMTIMERNPTLWDQLQNQTLLVLPVLEVLHIPDALGMDAAALVSYHNRMIQKIQQQSNHSTDAMYALEEERSRRLAGLSKLRTYTRGTESDLPASREDLKTLYQLTIARPWHTGRSQEPSNLTQYWRWNRNSTKEPTYPIKPTTKYEPYFVGYKPKLPRYWEAFRGFGLNKQSFVRECILAGFSFEGIYELYVTHLAHPGNINRGIKSANKDIWMSAFVPHLKRTYPTPKHRQKKREPWFSLP